MMNTVQLGRRNLATIQELAEKAIEAIECCEELSEQNMWAKHGPSIWKANKFVGSPHFYPVYKYEDFYSYSPLSLILLKGNIRLNRRVVEEAARPTFTYYSGMDTIDRDISRVGGPLKPGFIIRKPDDYARAIANAMREDISAIESEHPGFINIILCGGKDSLNLSLLPWKNPVMLASQAPNYDLVKKFVADNGLKYDVVGLEDEDSSLLNVEILVNCCRNNLEHCRWGPHLKKIADGFEGKAIFWKGQLGDTFLTPYWRTYTHPPNIVTERVDKLVSLFGGRGAYKIRKLLDECKVTQRMFFRGLWSRGAMWQGSHVGMLRQLTEALVLSGYHGPAVRRVLSQVDLQRAVQEDVRPIIGRHLRNDTVLYPKANPGPPLSDVRKGISHLEPFVSELSSLGVVIHNG